MKFFKIILFVFCLFNQSFSYAQSPLQDKGERLLFIGNSLTYYNDVPSMVTALYSAINTNTKVESEIIANGGYSLEQHLQLPLSKLTIESGEFSTIVLQDFGGWPMCSTEIPACSKTSQSLETLINIIKKSKKRAIWYSTFHLLPKLQEMLTKQTTEIAKDLQVDLADVGAALQYYIERNKAHSPFASDGHLNELGSWIAAATIVKSMIGRKLPKDIKLDEVCLKNWHGNNLNAEKLASEQKPKNINCIKLSKEDLDTIIFAVNKS